MRARSQNNSKAVLIAAISGRALAAAARRAGYRALVADFFCDDDTRALAERTAMLPGDLHNGIDPHRIVGALKELCSGEEPLALISGSAFERRPELIETLARHFPLAGCSGEAIRRTKDPERFAADCAELGIPHPQIRRERPDDPQSWLVKRDGGAGGTHISRANGDAAAPGRYFQRFVEGRSVSALFVGDGTQAHVVGFSRQFASPAANAPYRYGGAVRLSRFDRKDAATIGGWLSALTRRCNLVGLCSADLICNAEGYHLLEINPRPGATLDIFDTEEAPLIEAHLCASRGQPVRLPAFCDCMASVIAYTDSPLKKFPRIDWPDWAADRQPPGTALQAGDPVCTIFARGANIRATRHVLNARARELQRQWAGGAQP